MYITVIIVIYKEYHQSIKKYKNEARSQMYW